MKAPADQLARLNAGLMQLTQICSEGVFASGAQLAVSVDGEAPSIATVGTQLGEIPLRDEHLFNVWCASKPVPAVVLMTLLEQHGVSLDDRLAEIAERFPADCDLTIGQVLCHNAGLNTPHVVSANLMPYERAAEISRELRSSQPMATFSEFAASVVVSDLIEALSGRQAQDTLAEFLHNSDLARDVTFCVAEDLLDDPFEKFGFFLLGQPQRCVPMLHDALPAVAQLRRDVLGAYANARGLCSFYRLVGKVLHGEAVKGFPSPDYFAQALTHRRGSVLDAELQKSCDFAAGFMVDLSDHGYGAGVSPAAVGHTGMMGSPFGWYDPATRVAAAVIVNGFSLSVDDYDGWRPQLIAAIGEAATPEGQ